MAIRVVRQEWLRVLVSLLGIFEIGLAATANGAVVGLGVVSGVLVVTAPWIARRMPVIGSVALVVGTVPFAAVTWWSLIVPVVALLALAIGVPVALRPSAGRDTEKMFR